MLAGSRQAEVWATKLVMHPQDPELHFTDDTYISKKQTSNPQ